MTLAELRAIVDAATPGPWTANEGGRYGAIASQDVAAIAAFVARHPQYGQNDVAVYGGALVGESMQEADRAFCVAAREMLPALIEAAETLLYVRDNVIDDKPEMWRRVNDALAAVGVW